MTERRKVILDTDPGIDDMLAIMLAWSSPEFELLGVTTVSGNVPVAQGTSHAIAVREALQAPGLPIFAGCSRPLARPLRTQKDVYGQDEDTGLPFNPDWRSSTGPRNAVQFLIEEVSRWPGEITLFPLAPLTNLAAAILLDPDFPKKVKELYIMGGAAAVPGNTSPLAEFNFWVDPEAAKIVFESGMPITMIGLDVTGKTALWPGDAFELERLDTPVSRFIRQITRHYLDRGRPCFLYDPLAVAVGLQPGLVRDAPLLNVQIETQGEVTSGASVVDLRRPEYRAQPPNARVCLQVDSEAFHDLFWQRVVHYRPGANQ